MPQHQYDIDHKIGDNNIQVMGMDVHNPVFFGSGLLIALFVAITLVAPTGASGVLEGARAWTLEHTHWLFSGSMVVIFGFCVLYALMPFGRIRIGGPSAEPEFGTLSWLAMLFSAGVGIGLLFWGAAEPLAYFTGWSGTPLNAEAGSEEARRLAMSATIFHWGLHPWAVYALMGLALAFFTYNKGLPLTIRSCFYPILGERVWGWSGHVIDILAVIATLFGLATSLGFGAMQAAAGLNTLFGIDPGISTQIGVIAVITTLATLSVVRGLDKGIKVLSNVNIVMAIGLLLFVLLAGPTIAILTGIPNNTAHYLASIVPLANWFDRPDFDWYQTWTVFYWAWWISWSPFVGMFIARVSKGRTVRQFLAAVLIMPAGVSIVWFTVFGTTAISQAQAGLGKIAEPMTDASLTLFHMLVNLPMAEIVSSFAIVLLLIFFVTSSDSGSLVIDTITAGGKLHAPVAQRIFWAFMEGLVAAILLFGGGGQVLGALQAGAIVTALPFSLVLLLCCVSLYKGLSHEWRKDERLRDPAPTETVGS
ncbi:MAG: BCCT family transporter [Pseudomonadota bacterium]